MSEKYIKGHFDDIKKYANAIESRGDDAGCTLENVLKGNAQVLELARKNNADYILIEDEYRIAVDL